MARKRLLASLVGADFKRNESIDVKRPLPPPTHASLHNNCDHRHLVYPVAYYMFTAGYVKADCAEFRRPLFPLEKADRQ
jgi:hypothetical protein